MEAGGSFGENAQERLLGQQKEHQGDIIPPRKGTVGPQVWVRTFFDP